MTLLFFLFAVGLPLLVMPPQRARVGDDRQKLLIVKMGLCDRKKPGLDG